MHDHKLPGLARALDDEGMRRMLSGQLAWHTGHTEITQLQHRVLKHAPGKRCVIEYRLQLNGSARGVIGKLYRESRGAKRFRDLRNLWDAVQSRDHQGTFFGMPQPLAYLPELEMVVQDVVPGQPLRSCSVDDLPGALQCVARNLATLHGLVVVSTETKRLNDYVKRYCRPGPEALQQACPELMPLLTKLLHGLANATELQTVPLCPVHGDLGFGQIFVGNERAFFVDFDGFCLSHAARDLSNFLVALTVHYESQSSELTEIFLEAYLEGQPRKMLAGLRIYQALAYMRRAMICLRVKSGTAWRQQVRRLLETGNALLKENSPIIDRWHSGDNR